LVRERWKIPGTLIAAFLALGAGPAFDRKPWLADLAQMRTAFATKYSDLEFEILDREIDMNALFADAGTRIEAADSDGDARAAFERLIRKIDDGHVEIHWPQSAPVPAPTTQTDRCRALGYNSVMFAKPLAALAPGYRAIPAPAEFASGVLEADGHKVGVLKIGLFSPKGTPELCADALRALSIDPNTPCDDACDDRVENWGAAQMTRDLESALHAIDRSGAETLLVDVAGNGGGTEWAEAAMRMTTSRLEAEHIAFVRGAHWAEQFSQLSQDLHKAAGKARPGDRAFLLKLAQEADAKREVALTPCDSEPLWNGKRPACGWLGEGFYGSGLVAAADPAELQGKSWAPLVFYAAEFPYEEGVWRKPLLVLIDGGTGSAASQFAAVLQDNRAAIILGSPAIGGCGHTNGGTPTILANSKAELIVPDCVRYRADGSNEADGIEPDVLVGFAPGDGPHRKAARMLAMLPEALARAEQLAPRPHAD
jgi:hypothetical protein